GMGVVETASGAARVVEHQMADLIRKVTVHKGYDPRDFAVFAYGGAGPVHAGVYARELGAESLIVPLGGVCSLWSARGAATADFHRRYETLYGSGAGFREARVEIVTYRVRTTAVSAKPAIRPAPERGAAAPAASRAGTRNVYWAELGDFAPTPVFWGERLEPG